jgi:hypothetical protein
VSRALAVLAALALAASAAGATTRDRTVAGPVTALGVAATDVAYAVRYRPLCHEVRAWETASRADRRVARHCFDGTSTGSGVTGAITTRGRTLWLAYTGGNIREWSLWTRGGRAQARRVAFLTGPVDDPAPVVLGRPWEGSLPYAVGRTIVALRPDGSRRLTATAPARVRGLTAHSRGFAAVLETGSVLTIALDGRILREHTFAADVETAVLTGIGLVAELPDGLEIRGSGPPRTVSLPRGARFLGYADGLVAYGVGTQLRLRSLADGRDRVFRTLAPGFHAELGRRGLAWASGRTLGFRARALLGSGA